MPRLRAAVTQVRRQGEKGKASVSIQHAQRGKPKGKAQLSIKALSGLGSDVREFVIDCRHAATTAVLVPGLVNMTDEEMVTSLLFTHESSCPGGSCTRDLWEGRADPKLHKIVEQQWARLQAAAMRDRRN
jgi:hypothetical protein